MKIVKITFPNEFPILRQLPPNDNCFDGIRFVVNEDIDECDYWIVYDNFQKSETSICSAKNTILFAGEPSTVRIYNRKFIKQFSTLVTIQKFLPHTNKILTQPYLPWLVGIKYDKSAGRFENSNFWSFSDFESNHFKDKKKLISIITSNKALSRGHKQRLKFLKTLKEELGEQLEIFGSGFNDLEDKMDALRDFKYTVVIENSQHANYWTEKLADAYLCDCYPIYYGCSNVFDYFDKNSLTQIDIRKTKQAISKVLSVINNKTYETSRVALGESKQKVLYDYNFFTFLYKLIQGSSVDNSKKLITLQPEKANFLNKIQNKLLRIL